jgi:hypothetical protein
MSDIISARCFGCGNVIKVPAGLGGKKARCPQCTNTISIPMPNDTVHDDIISDAELPEVAVGNTAEREEGDAAIPGQEEEEAPAEDPSETRRGRGGTNLRNRGAASAASNPRVQRSGTQQRYAGAPAPAPGPATGSSQGMMIGIGLGVVALIILAVVVANNGDSSKHGGRQNATKEREKDKPNDPKNQPQYGPEDQALVSKLMDYTSAINRANLNEIQRFFTYEPDDERKVRLRIGQDIIDKKIVYEGVKVTSVSAATGQVSFSYNGGTKSLQWKQVDGQWLIAELPSP